MSDIKICVYAICKNEEKFVDRWYDSVKGADYICVLDTGSTDGTIEKLKQYDIIYDQKIISPWRFDVARNESLKLIPADTDIFVCLDLDEVLSPGWIDELKKIYNKDITRFYYKFVWNYNEDGSEGIMFFGEKIHGRGYKWKYPVHEILTRVDPTPEVRAEVKLCVEHHADNTKSRSNYLPLLELAYSENPEDDRTVHYLGREYFFYGQWEKAIEILKLHLLLRSSTWGAERATSIRYISKAYFHLGQITEGELWAYRAIAEAPEYRESYMNIIEYLYDSRQWNSLIYYANLALNIKTRPMAYLCEPKSWSEYLNDVLSIAYWNTGNKIEAIKHCQLALELKPNNKRILNNLELMTRGAIDGK